MIKLKKLLSAIFFFPIIVFIGIFTASNTSNIDIYLWPFGKIFNLPVWITVIFSLFIGLLIGSLITKLSVFLNSFEKKKSLKNVSNL